MPQYHLDGFYRVMVDVYFNLERTHLRNGWPLGGEAIIQGAVLFSTERYQQNIRNGFNFTTGLTIVQEGAGDLALAALHKYAVNPARLRQHSLAIPDRAFALWSYDRQMKVILDAIEERAISRNSTRER